jgi:hypothetical protein
MNYQICIPSYRRAKTLKEKTLSVLTQYNIDPSRVTIFVADENEKSDYERELANTPYNQIVVGKLGIGNQRRFIQAYYPVGTRVVSFDDDISEVLRKVDDKTVVKVDNLERDVIVKGFDECEKNNAHLFGIYAVNNPMFMKDRVSVGLYFCVGTLHGMIIRHDPDLTITIDEKDDYQRTLQHYVKDGAVVRLDYITIKTKYYTEPGGMQGTDQRKAENILKNAKFLEDTYPGLCTMYIRESKGRAELRLRDTRKNIEPVTNTLDSLFD